MSRNLLRDAELAGKPSHSARAAAADLSGEAELTSSSPELNPRQQTVLSLQQTHGNAAVRRMLPRIEMGSSHNQADRPMRTASVQRRPRRPARETIPDAPDWADEAPTVRDVQTQLRRLGLYNMGIDTIYGHGTDAGLVEAFGGDEFRTLEASEALNRLRAAVPPSGRRGDHNLRYGEMFRDGILDMTLGLGYDEAWENSPNPREELDGFRGVLADRGFVEDAAQAQLLYQQAGRALGPSAFGMFFIKRDALTYTPPAGAPRQIHAVVRLVTDPTGANGGQAAGAFREGMVQSDVTYYAGHGRYGSGPDFDRNFASFDILDQTGASTQQILDYEVLERFLRAEGARHGRGAWEQFLFRVNHQAPLIRVNASNEGNVFVNPTDLHSGEFGARLMYWNLNRQGTGASPVTGRNGELAQAADAHPERRYRLMVFDGCRTQDYETSLRSTPGMGAGTTETMETRRTVFGEDDVRTLAAFLDSVLGRQSAQQIVEGMNREQVTHDPGERPGTAFVQHGSTYDPTVR